MLLFTSVLFHFSIIGMVYSYIESFSDIDSNLFQAWFLLARNFFGRPTRLRTASKTLREFSVETKGIFNTRTLCLLRYGELPRCVYIMRPSFVLFTISYSCFRLYNYYTLFWKIVITLFSLCTHRLSKSHYFQHEFEKVDVISVIGNLYFCIFPFKGQWKLYSSLALCTLWLYLFVWIKPLA